MKLITRDTDYAIRALCCMAKTEKELISAAWLVRNLKVPRPFLRKILQALNRKKILKSYKGKGGGFSLNVSPEKILLVDLIKIFQGKLKINACFLKKSVCPDIKACKLKKKIDSIERYVFAELRDVTVASLLD